MSPFVFTGVDATFSLAGTAIIPIDGDDLTIYAFESDPDVNGRSYRRAALCSTLRGVREFQAECWWTPGTVTTENPSGYPFTVIRVRSRLANTATWSGWRYFLYDGSNLPLLPLTQVAEDHASVTMEFSRNGKLWICYDTRNSPVNCRVSTYAIELFNGDFEDEQILVSSQNEAANNYVSFFQGPGGHLHLLTRFGASEGGVILGYLLDDRTTAEQWIPMPGTASQIEGGELITGVLLDGNGVYATVYFGDMAFTPNYDPWSPRTVDYEDPTQNEGAWVVYHFRQGGATSTLAGYSNSDVGCLWTNGEYWYHADGTGQTVPVRPGSVNDVIDPVAPGNGPNQALCCTPGIAVDAANLPTAGYVKNDGSGYIQGWATAFNGTSWQTPVQLTSGTTLGTVGDPESLDKRSLLMKCRQRDGLILAVLNRFELTGVHLFHTEDRTSYTDVQLDARDAQAWSPVCDSYQLRVNEQLMLPVQSNPGYHDIIDYDLDQIDDAAAYSATYPSVNTNSVVQAGIDAFIAGLASDGLDSSVLDMLQLYVQIGDTVAFADMFNTGVSGSPDGAVNYRPRRGVWPNGLNSVFDTNWNPSTDATNYTLNDCCVGVYVWNDMQSSGTSGCRTASGGNSIQMRFRDGSGNCRGALNSVTDSSFGAVGASNGLFIFERTGASAIAATLDNVSIGSAGKASTGIPNANLALGGLLQNDGTQASWAAYQFGLVFAGSSLGSTLRTAINNRWSTLRTILTS